jgi:asparagine synthase (glutamine-hydrolysing)
MCGICGKLNFDGNEPVRADLLGQMMDVIAHRGPDGSGDYRQGPIGLGHRRLSIIDLSTGDQPMCGEDGTVTVVFNGEIYNFRELRAELEARGHRFKSNSDTEVIVHGYEEFGEHCVGRLSGMFAFALWDARNRVLLVARDRVGIKPLYYTNTGRSLLFGSEIKSLLCDPDVVRRINPRAIDRFLTYYYTAGADTPLEGIYKLPPGHYLRASGADVSIKQYWDLRFGGGADAANFERSVAELQELLGRTVKSHMISDVPVGVLLSGGVDSTGVLRYAAEAAPESLHSFTVGFDGEQFADERPYARLAAKRYRTRHQEITVSATEFRDFLPQYVWHMEEPVCEPPALALYFVSRLARQTGVKVVLSGEGGDEAFGGYQTYRNLLILERLKSGMGPAKPLLRKLLSTAAQLGWNRVQPYSSMVDPALADYYLSRTATPASPFNRVKSSLYRPEFAARLGRHDSREPSKSLFARVSDRPLLDQMLYVDTKTWLPDDLLVKADKMTMATSVELRVPLLDYQVLEFAASLPQSFKVRGLSGKRILKAALNDSVPREILDRRKTGFPVPYDRWLRVELKDFVHDALNSRAALMDFFTPAGVQQLVDGFYREGKGSKEIFSLLVLELWLQRFLAPIAGSKGLTSAPGFDGVPAATRLSAVGA